MILPMFHLQLMGLNNIDLKQLVRSDTRMNPDEFHLKGIEVSVKSRQQGGQVWLVSGHKVSEFQDVRAAGRFFASNDPDSYGRNYFKVGQGNNQSMPWLLKLNGDIKLNAPMMLIKFTLETAINMVDIGHTVFDQFLSGLQ